MPLTASSMLGANQPQTPNGTALNASAMLGLPGLGNNLQDDMKEQLALRRKQLIPDPKAYGADLLDAVSSVYGGQGMKR